MGVREDFICDDFKTVPVPHLNRQFKSEEIKCTGYDINGYLQIPGLAKCETTYECSRWQDSLEDYQEGKWVKTSCGLSTGLSSNVFSHCSQCNMCTSIEDDQIKVRNEIYSNELDFIIIV